VSNWDESVEKFDELDLKEEVLRGIYGYGFERPSPIQQKAILPVIQGRDTIAQVLPAAKLYRLNQEQERLPHSQYQSCNKLIVPATNAKLWLLYQPENWPSRFQRSSNLSESTAR
jgi:hypothetical protein